MNSYSLKSWHKIILGILLFIFILLFAAPRIARYYLVNNSTEILGRRLEINKLRLNYFSGVIRIEKLALFELDTQNTFVSFDKLRVNISYWPLLRNEFKISKISLEGLYSQVEQDGDWFNFSDLIVSEDSLALEEPPVDSSESESMLLTINNISIAGSQIFYTDLLLDHTISLDDINLFIPGFSFSSGSTDLALDFDFAQGGNLHTALFLNQIDSTYAVDLQLDSLNLAIIEPYVKTSIAISGLEGYFSNDIVLKGSLQHLMQIQMKGWNKIDGLVMRDLSEREVLRFDQFFVNMDTFLLDENIIRISEIALIKPYILFELIDTTNNWLAMLPPSDTTVIDTLQATDNELEDSTIFQYTLSKVYLQNGLVEFNDKTITIPYETQIGNINIISKEIDAEASEVSISIEAIFNETAEISSKLVLNLTDPEDILAELNLKKFAMKELEPYLQHYYGYPVESGFLNFSTNNDLTANSMLSENKISIRNFKLGKPNKEDAVYRLPLKLAIGILSDKDGMIELDIPVESEGEETTIKNLGRLVVKTFANLIVKAATKPAELLASLYGANPDKLREVKIGLFSDTPDEENLETLDMLAKILLEKPQLSAELRYTLDENFFTDSLSLQAATLACLEANNTGGSLPDSVLLDFLERKLNKPDNSPQELPGLCKEFVGTDFIKSQLDSTQARHIDFINDYLKSHKALNEEQFSIVLNKKDTIPEKSPHAHFKIQFLSEGDI